MARNADRDWRLMLSWLRALFPLIFTPGQFSLKLLLANRLRGAATDDNLKRILSETDNGVNRWEKILKVIRPSQVGKIITFNTLP
jgi:hypothetical protein